MNRGNDERQASRRLRSASIAHLQLSPGPRIPGLAMVIVHSLSLHQPSGITCPPILVNRDAPSLDSFKSLLKTHLFIQS